MGDVVKAFGDYGTPGPVPAIIKTLETLLARAKRGEIVSLAYALVKPNAAATYGLSADTGNGIALLGAVGLLHHDIASTLNDTEEVTAELP